MSDLVAQDVQKTISLIYSHIIIIALTTKHQVKIIFSGHCCKLVVSRSFPNLIEFSGSHSLKFKENWTEPTIVKKCLSFLYLLNENNVWYENNVNNSKKYINIKIASAEPIASC